MEAKEVKFRMKAQNLRNIFPGVNWKIQINDCVKVERNRLCQFWRDTGRTYWILFKSMMLS